MGYEAGITMLLTGGQDIFFDRRTGGQEIFFDRRRGGQGKYNCFFINSKCRNNSVYSGTYCFLYSYKGY